MRTKITILVVFMMVFSQITQAQSRRERRLERQRMEQLEREKQEKRHEDETLPRPQVQSDQTEQRRVTIESQVVRDDKPLIRIAESDFVKVFDRAEPLVTQQNNGEINWSGQYIEARGESVIDMERFSNPAQARAMAVRGAVVVAQRNLLEIINGVQVTSESKVIDMIAESDYIVTRVDGIVRGARMVGDPAEKYGMIEVTLRIDLYEPGGLAPIVYESISDTRRRESAKTIATPVQRETQAARTSADGRKVADQTSQQEILEALVLNLQGKNFDPALFPVLIDEEGNILLDLTQLYDPRKGNFPKILHAGREIFDELGFKEGVQVIDVISNHSGTLTIDKKHTRNIDWGQIGRTIGTIGKLALMFL